MSVKRKLQTDEGERYMKNNKIMKLSETLVEMSDVADMVAVNDERKFNFKLTDKKAKSNLIKSASRAHLEIETKQLCKNMRFSAGAYIFVAKQMVKECETKFKTKSSIFHENMEIKIAEFKDGKELDDKHFDTKIVYLVNNNKVVLHCYNSTQNLKVEGSIYLDFIRNFLEPLFLANIEIMRQKIVEYDQTVVKTLQKKPNENDKPWINHLIKKLDRKCKREYLKNKKSKKWKFLKEVYKEKLKRS